MVIDTKYKGVNIKFSADSVVINFERALFDELYNDHINDHLKEYDLFIFLKDELVQEGLADIDLNNSQFVINYDQFYKIRTSDRLNYFELPDTLTGTIKFQVKGINVSDKNFRLKILFYSEENVHMPLPINFYGAILQSNFTLSRLNEKEYQAFKCYEAYKKIEGMGYKATDHLELIALFKQIKRDGLAVDVSRYENLTISTPEKISLNLTELENGDLQVTPNLNGLDSIPDGILKRELNNIDKDSDSTIINNRDELIRIAGDQKKAIDEIKQRPIIKKNEVEEFFKSPGSFYNGDLIDLDSGFSIRVIGIVEYTRVSHLEMDDEENDWFRKSDPVSVDVLISLIKHEEELESFKAEFKKAKEVNAGSLIFEGTLIDISKVESIEELVENIQQKIEDNKLLESNTSSELTEDKTTATTFELDIYESESSLASKYKTYHVPEDLFQSLNFQPKEYQKEGINWIYSLYRSSLNTNKEIQGGILADDMGLGKTFTSLVAMSAIRDYAQSNGDNLDKPLLVVAPLSLLQNWKDEVFKFFTDSPFEDIVLLNAQEELNQFRLESGNERNQKIGTSNELDASQIKYCLKIGQNFKDRLDIPGRLVICTYDTLRNFQFSLARVPWSCVVFDEAQYIKNSSTLSSRAAKALNADVKILATGTPVENKLEEYWSIMDTANPKLFGNRKLFVEKYVRPLKNAAHEEEKIKIGQLLYQQSGPFLLRRLKEDVLKELPEKHVYYGLELPGEVYDAELDQPLSAEQVYHEEKVRENINADTNPGAALKGIHGIKNCYLHPTLTFNAKTLELLNLTSEAFWAQSARLRALRKIINRVADHKNDKLIIFTTYRTMQKALKKRIQLDFNISAKIISGETKTKSYNSDETRKGIIENFEQQSGFQILILSPIAAGVGLNITAANHVFHLDRHWNPAKEAQANDRVYRIGQEKEVYIYYPISKSKNGESFDIKMNKLLNRKIGLKDTLLTYPANLEKEMAAEYFSNHN